MRVHDRFTDDPTPARHSAEAASVAVRQLRHVYRKGDRRLSVLDGLDLVVEARGYLAVTGASGAGKSTLLSLLGGLERPQAGDVVVAGVNVAGLVGDELAHYRRTTVGFVFQHFGLLEALSAMENVELACTLAGVARGERRARAHELLSAVGLGPRAAHRPQELSGGERQRVAIARAMANRPSLLLADEPTGNLDEDSTGNVLRLLEEIHAEGRSTLVVVTHNARVAARASTRLDLRNGRLWPA
jgi:ABC-type lipoprotein export system ATPase subunit